MKEFNEALGFIAIAIGFVSIVFIIARYTYLVKKAAIENGLMSPPSDSKVKYIDIGCIVTGLGIGILVSSIYTEMDLTEDTTDLLVWGTISIFGGVSLIIAHFLRKRLEK